RAATGRSHIVKFLGCYHGHVDALLVAAGSGAATFGQPDSAGVPKEYAELTLLAPYNDRAAIEALMSDHGSDVAAILVEPIAGNMGFVPPAEGFLATLRDVCDSYGVVLIFDEVMTGFRTAWGGYQNVCGIEADLTCLGKVIGGGLPVGAYGGRREIMERMAPLGDVYQAGTLSGNPLSMAAGIITLRTLSNEGAFRVLDQLGEQLTDGLIELARRAEVDVQLNRIGSMFTLFFVDAPVTDFATAKRADTDRYARFFRAMLERGIYLPPAQFEACFLSLVHLDAEIEETLAAAEASFGELSSP
ncbi:MAG: glutamate-1-semialdehyde 2,1-aminomutase, partial [Chloroflexi bacterium]|nr:glutamate-1-semialdehyde 2,1-aminomutase [Chloroflexota bacterium]